MRLYEHYPDHFFEPHHLGTGYYFGIRSNDELISVAGIHNISLNHDVAAIGNIVTHLDHRGHGLAAKCVRRLLDELFQSVNHVCLNVGLDNTAAIACYQKIGFKEHRQFIEGWATAR
ncbi:MAG: GNAT family N-acetyltransferase [Myxococcota bacterium]|nr:GNAT family N-acetyltransferase [Myxococcota bacterium]